MVRLVPKKISLSVGRAKGSGVTSGEQVVSFVSPETIWIELLVSCFVLFIVCCLLLLGGGRGR